MSTNMIFIEAKCDEEDREENLKYRVKKTLEELSPTNYHIPYHLLKTGQDLIDLGRCSGDFTDEILWRVGRKIKKILPVPLTQGMILSDHQVSRVIQSLPLRLYKDITITITRVKIPSAEITRTILTAKDTIQVVLFSLG